MQVTEQLIHAIERSAGTSLCTAQALERSENVTKGGDVARVLLESAEQHRQDADLMNGWAERARREMKMPPKNET